MIGLLPASSLEINGFASQILNQNGNGIISKPSICNLKNQAATRASPMKRANFARTRKLCAKFAQTSKLCAQCKLCPNAQVLGLPNGVLLGFSRGPFGVLSGSSAGPFGVLLGSFWGPLGVLLGSSWGPFEGVLLGSSWGSLGVLLGSCFLKQ